MLLLEFDEVGDDALRALVLDPLAGFIPLEWAGASVAPVAIAGRYAAAFATRPRRLAIVDLITGAPEATARVIASFQGGRPVLLGAARKALDPPSSVPTGLAADARGVAWLANG